MKCVGFLVATTFLCQIGIGTTAIRRRRGYIGPTYDPANIEVEDPFLKNLWWHDSRKQAAPQPVQTVSYDVFGIKRGDYSDGTREGETRMYSPTKGHTSTPNKGYGGNGWWDSWAVSGTKRPVPSSTETSTSVRIASCIKSCPVTAEHNPVCGSNNVTYANPGRLECAQRCGVEVELSRLTACSVPVPAYPGAPVDREVLVNCLRRCSISDVFNPVCGSNNRTYENPERLFCEQKCGIPVQLIKLSPCIDPEPTTTQNNEEQISACIRSCSVTGEFNPVCGSNNVTYNNPGRLECAQNCGVAVQLSRNTSCTAPLTADAITRSTTELNQITITISTSDRPYINGNAGSQFNWDNKEETTGTPSGDNLNGNNDYIINLSGQNDGNNLSRVNSSIGFDNNNSSIEKNNLNGKNNGNGDNNFNGGNNVSGQEIDNGGNDKINNTKEEKLNSATNGNDDNNGNDGNVLDEKNNGKSGSKGYHGGGGSYGGNNANSGNGFNGGHGGNNGHHGHYPGSHSCNGVNNQKTPSVKEVMACMQSCSLTNELNPVCGTDAITYTNPGRLLCAQFCGIDVKVRKFASCSSSSTTNYHCPTAFTNPPVTGNIETFTPPPSSPVQACMDACPTSMEFKPVCGSNKITYKNLEKLQCARRCGIDVSLVRNTHCSAPAANPSPNGSSGIPPVWTEKPNNLTPKPDGVQECIKKCPVSQSYEPICGSDNVTYNNTGHLICARNCGRDIRVKLLYPCLDGETPSPNPTTEKNQVSPGQNGLNFTISPDVLANIWSETTPKEKPEEEFDLDQRVQDQL